MHRCCAPFLNLLLVFGLIVSGLFVTGSPISSATSEARVAPPGSTAADNVPALGSKRANLKHDRRADRKQERKRDCAKTDRKQDDKQKERSQDRKRDAQAQEQNRTGDWQEFCTGPDSIPLPRVDLCTHGADPAPTGFDIEQPVEPLTKEAALQETASLSCDGDGQTGFRVQVLYVRASDVAPRSVSPLTSIQGCAGTADQIFRNSAADTGGNRGVRFVHDSACQPIVQEVMVSPAGDGNFSTMVSELSSHGFNRTDRIYLAFVDARVYCGVGTVWRDDRPNSANWNNSGPSYFRVDNGCWSGSVAAHELMHNLGGVQLSAPNTSGGYHCIDEYDVMCYSDAGSGQPQMRVDCANQAYNTTRFDCGHDDYYNTNPAPGSYLASYWNPANNRFLTNAAALAEPPPPPPPPVVEVTPTTTGKDKKGKSKGSKDSKGSKGGKHNRHKKKH